MTGEVLRIKVEFNDNAANIVRWYALDQETLRKAQLWQGQRKTTPTARQLAAWLDLNGGLLDREDGPAIIATYADGCRREAWYSKDQRDREDGPAIIETYADGRRRETWYSKDQFVREETLASPAAIPGVTLYPPPAP